MSKIVTSKRAWLAKYECEKYLVALSMKNVKPMSPMWCWWFDYAVSLAVNILLVKREEWKPWK